MKVLLEIWRSEGLKESRVAMKMKREKMKMKIMRRSQHELAARRFVANNVLYSYLSEESREASSSLGNKGQPAQDWKTVVTS